MTVETPRLCGLDGLPADVARPRYDPAAHGVGIVHLGLGAFHRAHQAVYTDDALAAAGGDWRITGVSLRSAGPRDALSPQNGLYTVLERGGDGGVGGDSGDGGDGADGRARVIGAIASALTLSLDRAATLRALTDPATRIVSITVTEKGYGLDRATGGVDLSHPAIAADLRAPGEPVGVAGLIVQALGARRAAGIAPFTVLSCDNLPENGRLTRGLTLDFAKRVAPRLAAHIAEEVAFPCAMVDRITPASGPALFKEVARRIGRHDAAAVETESFSQWVIEDRFPAGRPAWEAGGAIFVDDVAPYERMKLRMLNGAHSMLAYAGFLSGRAYVRDAMADPALARLIHRHLDAAAATLNPLPGVSFADYAGALAARFANPHLAHETYQIAMDGTEKLPQRVFAPAVDALTQGQPLAPFAFATAAWMRYALGRKDDGAPYALRDPREAEIAARLDGARDAPSIVAALLNLPKLFPPSLREHAPFAAETTARLGAMLDLGVARAVAAEAAADVADLEASAGPA